MQFGEVEPEEVNLEQAIGIVQVKDSKGMSQGSVMEKEKESEIISKANLKNLVTNWSFGTESTCSLHFCLRGLNDNAFAEKPQLV
jgi:hypothetical protein